MSYRDPEFREMLDGFVAVSALDHTKKLPKDQVCMLNRFLHALANQFSL